MRVHFSASVPCLLRLGGATAGYCGEAEKFADLPEEENVVAEFFPLSGEYAPLAFVLGKEFFSAPPSCCDVYRYSCGADLFAAEFSARKQGMRVVEQVRAGGVLATVFLSDGRAQLALETAGGAQLYSLPRAQDFEACEEKIGGKAFVRLHCRQRGRGVLFLYGQDGTQALRADADEWESGEKLVVREKFADIAAHTAESVYAFGEGGFLQESRTLRVREGFDLSALDERLLPFALFQEIAAGGDPAPFLAPNLLEKKDLLSDYLGNFCQVRLPKEIFYLTHGSRNAAALAYRRADNLFEIRFFEAEVKERKICNLKPVE